MMVPIAQSDSAEDSHGRQLRVSKKLSKAISAVPRSRFQKPRPNLPGCKRSITVPVATRKIIGTSEKLENGNTSVLGTVCTLEDSCKADTLTIKDISENANLKNAIQNADCTSLNGVDNTLKVNSDETLERRDETVILNVDETCKEQTSHSPTLNINEFFEKKNERNVNKKTVKENVTNTDELFEKKNEQNVNKKTVKENVTNTEERSEEESISSLSATNETLLEEDNRSTTTLCNESLPKPPEQEKNDTVNIPSSVTDRSSKYPHLTSILLSKKRTEPKREVQHKRRKKFRKGDVAPERSKMTMADLIYWNPINTDEKVVKSSANIEVQSTTTVEEEFVDGNVGQNSFSDSVPKLIISEDGQINIDQTSLIVSRNIPQPTVTEVIGKDETTYSSFRKRPLTKHWSVKDTTIFYKALSLVGTDFGLMEKIFPHRTRRELKQKFKREEKYNIDLINRAMYESQLTFDADTLEDLIEHLNYLSDGNSENADDFETPVKAKKKSNGKQKISKKTNCPIAELNDFVVEDTGISEVINKRKRKNKKLPVDFLDDNDIEKDLVSEDTNNDDTSISDVSKKRKRKTKKLPEDFLDDSDIEKTMDLGFEETNNDALEEKEKRKNKRKKEKSLPSDFVDIDVIDELTDTICKESHNDELLEVNINKSIEDSENESFIPVEYIEDIESVTDSTLMNNVMAFEVVTSQIPIKRNNYNSKILNKNKTLIPLGLSSTNYTPS